MLWHTAMQRKPRKKEKIERNILSTETYIVTIQSIKYQLSLDECLHSQRRSSEGTILRMRF